MMESCATMFQGRVATLAPGHGDLFVLTLLGDRVLAYEPITVYDRAVRRANELAKVRSERPFTVKVLALSGREARKLLGISGGISSLAPHEYAELREQIRANCIAALETCRDPHVMADAYDVLRWLGAVQ
ncbi:hypothetical protein [Thioclava marina]|nr:hypothetical protein [Thioclava marina]